MGLAPEAALGASATRHIFFIVVNLRGRHPLRSNANLLCMSSLCRGNANLLGVSSVRKGHAKLLCVSSARRGNANLLFVSSVRMGPC